jgi:hypothetical protein
MGGNGGKSENVDAGDPGPEALELVTESNRDYCIRLNSDMLLLILFCSDWMAAWVPARVPSRNLNERR